MNCSGWVSILFMIASAFIYIVINPTLIHKSTSRHFSQQNAPVYFNYKSQTTKKNLLKSPESFAILNDYIYMGLEDGSVVRISTINLSDINHLDDNDIELVIRTSELNPNKTAIPSLSQCADMANRKDFKQEYLCGRPLGLHFDDIGRLIVADASYGIARIESVDGSGINTHDNNLKNKLQITSLVSTLSGKDIIFANSVVVFNDLLYFTVSSDKFSRPEHMYEVMEAEGRGALYAYNFTSGSTALLVANIPFANGISLSSDHKKIFVAETSSARIMKYDILEGTYTVLSDNMICIPDNIKLHNHVLWVGCSQIRSNFVDRVRRFPFLIKLFCSLPGVFFKWIVELVRSKDGIIVALDEISGDERMVFYDYGGEAFKHVSEVQPLKGYLYVGSVYHNLKRIKINNK
ncbi:plasma membrane-associated protein [Acrasis kona]|uniref:Plasma membrane-associated protein n=1 Tax=Acrasis kona TaxID=1008807 RepID=A0AAW2ZCF4_9EUKA